ncbi:LmrB [Bacillus atrophaeus UCMB-5137]|nr:LmrB [Bacillus atrophaeus UCMB-5137]
MGIMKLVIKVKPAVGLTVSGLILKTLTWQWIFRVSLPLLIITLVFGAFFMQDVTEPTKLRKVVSVKEGE